MTTPTSPPHSQQYLDANRGPSVEASTLTVSILSTIFVVARVFTRSTIMGKTHADDWLTVVAVFFLWGCVGLSLAAVHSGNGRHFDTLTEHQQENVIFFTILNFPFGIMAFGIPKLAVVALLTRILNPGKWHRVFLWSLSGLCVVALLGCIVILFGQCSPSASQWDFSITPDYCWSKWVLVNYAIFAGSLSAATDLYLAVYPAIVLWGLQMNIRKKLALCAALSIGSSATVIAIYKCTRLPSLASADFSYDTSDLVIWTAVEASTIIIASCIPCLQPLLELMFGRRSLASAPGYKQHSDERSGRLKSDIELEGSQSRPDNAAANSLKYTTVTSIEHNSKGDSQESILRPEDLKHGQQVTSPTRRAAGPSSQGIMRTDVVKVTYDGESLNNRSEQKSWGRV